MGKHMQFLLLSFAVSMDDLPPELWNKNVVHQSPVYPPGQTFSCKCGYPPSQLPTPVKSPSQLGSLHSLISCSLAHTMLRDHPNRPLVQFAVQGICQGFCIGFTWPPESLKSVRKNLEGAEQLPTVINDYISSELAMGHVVGSFPPHTVLQVHISRFGVIPKGQTGRWRLIVDLSQPKSHSVNDGISKPLCSLKYITIDEAIKSIIQGSTIGKDWYQKRIPLTSCAPSW